MSDEQPPSQTTAYSDGVFGSLFRTFIEPDLKSRIERGELPNPFPLQDLRYAQIVFYPDGKRPAVRINEEVRAIAEIRAKEGVVIEKGDPVSFEQIESVGAIGLADDEADFAHATFLQKPNGQWVGYFDFTYYKGTARRHLDVAEQFLEAARSSREKKHWVAFADTLFSAAELAAKASLYCLPFFNEILGTKRHPVVKAGFNRQRHIGNVDGVHTTAFNCLWDLRLKGRYLEAEINFDDEDADRLLRDITALLHAARHRASTFHGPQS